MHIPDGYLSPQTCAVAYAAAGPTWVVASRKVSRVVTTRNVPLLAMFAAISFLVMMFNIPIPDGTTAHAVGAVIVALVLGPWAAVIAVSVALLFQALLFGDGGVLAYGANVLNNMGRTRTFAASLERICQKYAVDPSAVDALEANEIWAAVKFTLYSAQAT